MIRVQPRKAANYLPLMCLLETVEVTRRIRNVAEVATGLLAKIVVKPKSCSGTRNFDATSPLPKRLRQGSSSGRRAARPFGL